MIGLAKNWPAYESWDSLNKPWADVKQSMTEAIGANTEVGVFELPGKYEKHITNAYSFAWSYETKLKYSQFLDKFDNERFNGQVMMRQSGLTEQI